PHIPYDHQIIDHSNNDIDGSELQYDNSIISGCSSMGDESSYYDDSFTVNEDNVNGNNIIYPKLKKLVNKFLKVIRKK
ncbi:296_t:CDS:1, partial [Entrophospora sp. SA101]